MKTITPFVLGGFYLVSCGFVHKDIFKNSKQKQKTRCAKKNPKQTNKQKQKQKQKTMTKT
jgi:hypothetical protein